MKFYPCVSKRIEALVRENKRLSWLIEQACLVFKANVYNNLIYKN
jgi:hypothetical protein